MWFQCSRFSLKFGVGEISQKLACSVCGVADGLFIGSLNRGKIQKPWTTSSAKLQHGEDAFTTCQMQICYDVPLQLLLVSSSLAEKTEKCSANGKSVPWSEALQF